MEFCYVLLLFYGNCIICWYICCLVVPLPLCAVYENGGGSDGDDDAQVRRPTMDCMTL